MPASQALSDAQFEATTPWESARHDAFTFRFAMDDLQRRRPRVLYIALDETDDWAHERNYERVLDALHRTTATCGALDAGCRPTRNTGTHVPDRDRRSRSRPRADDWSKHGDDVVGADETWLIAAGPGLAAARRVDQRAARLTPARWRPRSPRSLGEDFRPARPGRRARRLTTCGNSDCGLRTVRRLEFVARHSSLVIRHSSMLVFPWLVHSSPRPARCCAFLVADRRASTADFGEAFLWLAVSTVIDAVDGALARLARVKERTPHFNGNELDDIVDYLTFVFVPAFICWSATACCRTGRWACASSRRMLLSSAIRVQPGGRQDGRPLLHRLPVLLEHRRAVHGRRCGWRRRRTRPCCATFVVMVFVPIGYIYPSRTPQLRGV